MLFRINRINFELHQNGEEKNKIRFFFCSQNIFVSYDMEHFEEDEDKPQNGKKNHSHWKPEKPSD